MVKRPSISIVGAGRVGSALAFLLHRKGYPLTGVASRTLASARRVADALQVPATLQPEIVTVRADVVFITTPDRVIAPVASKIRARRGFHSGQVVFHTSGAHTSEEVGAARRAGAYAASLHPLQSFATVETALKNLPGSYFALDGDPEAMPVARQIVKDLKGKILVISTKEKPLYHAAACIASNYLVALMHWATGLYDRFGLSREEAFQALWPLIRGTLNNIQHLGPTQALTGPIDRGDGPTLQGHLEAMAGIGRNDLALYCKLGLYTIQVALEKGSIRPEQGKQMEKIFWQGIASSRIRQKIKKR